MVKVQPKDGVPPLTWTETFNCDICGKQKGSVDHWWLAWSEPFSPHAQAPERPMLKIYPWENLLAHDAGKTPLRPGLSAETGRPLAERGIGFYPCRRSVAPGQIISRAFLKRW